jgi:glyoxylase-like metal-dependent hydrolase (beta-lactamase superfamily II)
MALDEDEYVLHQDQQLSAQLGRLGYGSADISSVIVTHLHEDHIGGLISLRHANVVVAAPEWKRVQSWNRMARFIPFLAMEKFSPSIAGMATPTVVRFSSGPFHGFDRSEDLFDDASVVLLPTPGHTTGHLAALVRMDGYHVCAPATPFTPCGISPSTRFDQLPLARNPGRGRQTRFGEFCGYERSCLTL